MSPGFLSRTLEGVKQMFGAAPVKPGPADLTPEMTVLAAFKKSPEERKRRKAFLIAEKAEGHPTSSTWRRRRWARS